MTKNNTIYPGSHVATFLLDGHIYEHRIFCNEDDRVECRGVDSGELYFTYDSSCNMLDKHKRKLGKFGMSNNAWFYRTVDGSEFPFSRDLLQAEVEVSKMYLTGELT